MRASDPVFALWRQMNPGLPSFLFPYKSKHCYNVQLQIDAFFNFFCPDDDSFWGNLLHLETCYWLAKTFTDQLPSEQKTHYFYCKACQSHFQQHFLIRVEEIGLNDLIH